MEDWRGVHLWLGDERCVPLDDPDSNAVLVRDTLFAALPADGAGPILHRVERAGDGDPPAAAADYERELRATVAGSPLPLLDLALLGLGEDGHTASLFPDDPVLEERERLCRRGARQKAAARPRHASPCRCCARRARSSC